jgi:hypothetical protein
MKLLFLFFPILLFPFQNIDAQHFAWMRTAPDVPRAMALDPEGNILFQTLADPVNSWQTHQLRLVSPAGELLWSRDYPQIGLMAPLKTDAGGNFWFPVEGHGTVTVDGITHRFEEARPHAIAKMSPKGRFLSFGFDSRFPMDFEFDPAGNLYLCGSHLLQKFDPSGNLLWDVPPVFFEGIGNEIGLVNGMEIIGGDRIVIAGSFLYGQGLKARIADTSVLVRHSETMFFAGFDADGNRKWLRAGGGVNTNFLLSSDQTGTLIAAGNPFYLDFDGWQLPYDGSTHGPAIFKFSAATGEMLWHRNYPEWSWMNNLVPLANGSFYMAGQLRNIGDNDGNIPVGAAMYAREGNYQAFVARFGPDGEPRWLAVSNEGDFASLSGVLPAANGHVWLGGNITSLYGLRNTRFGSERLFQTDSTYGVIGLLLDTLAAPPPAATLNLQGKIFEDTTPDCQPGNGETGIADLSVLAEPGPFLAKTDANGNFRFRLPPGQYTLRPIERNDHSQRLTPLCKTTQNIDLQVDTTGVNFPFQREDCTSLASVFEAGGIVYCVGAEPNGSVDSTATLRVVFQNFGKQAIGSAEFKVEFPWPFYPVSSEWTATSFFLFPISRRAQPIRWKSGSVFRAAIGGLSFSAVIGVFRFRPNFPARRTIVSRKIHSQTNLILPSNTLFRLVRKVPGTQNFRSPSGQIHLPRAVFRCRPKSKRMSAGRFSMRSVERFPPLKTGEATLK